MEYSYLILKEGEVSKAEADAPCGDEREDHGHSESGTAVSDTYVISLWLLVSVRPMKMERKEIFVAERQSLPVVEIGNGTYSNNGG